MEGAAEPIESHVRYFKQDDDKRRQDTKKKTCVGTKLPEFPISTYNNISFFDYFPLNSHYKVYIDLIESYLIYRIAIDN